MGFGHFSAALAGVLMLAACASEYPPARAETFRSVQTRDEFFDAWMRYGIDPAYFEGEPPGYRMCLAQEYQKGVPQDLLDAADRYVKEKTEVSWKNFEKVLRSPNPPNFTRREGSAADTCKAKLGLD